MLNQQTCKMKIGVLIGMALVGLSAGCSAQDQEYEAAHEAAKWRERRIIQNNDGGEARVPRSPIQTADDLLAYRATPLIGSQVDTIIYDTTAGTFGMFAHDTEVAERFMTTEGRYRYNALPALLEQGTDPLQVMIDFCRDNDIEVFWTLRMNDTHDNSNPLLLPEFKKNNPHLLLGADGRPRHGGATGVNYEEPEIRELAFRIVEEVAHNYDVDGIQLDFFRHPVFFSSVAHGGVASDEQRELMTELIEYIRQMTLEVGRQRGKPLLLAIRIPDSVEYCRQIGLDVEKWLQDGLVDLLSTTCYFQLNPWEYSVELGHKYNVPVYPSLSESRIASAAHPWSSRRGEEVYRARAANVWQAGADGVYLFNAFNGTLPWWKQIGSVDTLVGLDKRYFVSIRGGDPKRYLSSTDSFDHMEHLSPDRPAFFEQGEIDFGIQAAEDFAAAEQKGLTPQVYLRLDLRPLVEPEDLEVYLNDTLLTDGSVEQRWLVYPVAAELLQAGDNRIRLLQKEANDGAQKKISELDYTEEYTARSGNRVTIRTLHVQTDNQRKGLTITVKAEGGGSVQPGSVSIRTPNTAAEDNVPDHFFVSGGYAYPAGWTEPGWLFEEGSDEVTVRVGDGWDRSKEYTLRIIAHTRPHEGTYSRDDRLFRFVTDENGAISIPLGIHDAHIDVTYHKTPVDD